MTEDKSPKTSKAQQPKSGQELLATEQAVEILGTSRPTLTRWIKEGKIKALKVGRQWRFYRQDLERFLKGQAPRVESLASADPLVEQLRGRLAELGKPPAAKLPPGTSPETGEDPFGQVAHLMVQVALASRAGDIHIHPIRDGQRTQGIFRVRIDGALKEVARFDIHLLEPVIERWKTLSGADPNVQSLPQDGRAELNVNSEQVDAWTCFVPSKLGTALTVRLLRPGELCLDLHKLGYRGTHIERIKRALDEPAGLIICTGQTGTGKTTMLYSCLRLVAAPEVKVMTAEDPVEYLLAGVVQCPVQSDKGLTFGRLVRAFLRSDSDVVLVGEIRDAEVANLCVQAALTGHLVLTTLHAPDAASALRRLVEVGVPAFVVADATLLVVAQRLARRLCHHCRRPGEPDEADVRRAGEIARAGGLGGVLDNPRWHVPVGCPECAQTGYLGRFPIAETLDVTAPLAGALRQEADADRLRRVAVEQGMTTLGADGIAHAAAGETTLREVLRVLAMR